MTVFDKSHARAMLAPFTAYRVRRDPIHRIDHGAESASACGAFGGCITQHADLVTCDRCVIATRICACEACK